MKPWKRKRESRNISMGTVAIRVNERIDDLQIRGYRLIQKTDGFCYGMDAVLLSDYAAVRPGSRLMDLCSGTGVIPILAAAKYETSFIEGLEYQAAYVEMSKRSLIMNGLEDRIRFYRGDVKDVKENFSPTAYDHVTCNPPYMCGSHGLVNANDSKAISRHEILCTLEDVTSAAGWLLRPGGHFTMIHRPFRLAEIFESLKKYRLEPKRMRLVYPYVDKEPNMVLIDAVKDGRPRITVDAPLIVYHRDGSYTGNIHRIYGDML